jgi:glycosyltransferase involved in cell wall biosynthesis
VRTTFIVPAYNEAPTIEEVLRRLERLALDKQVIVVDDGSTDATPAILARWAARHPDTLVLRKRNGGKGSALRAAIPWIEGEIAVIQDADLEYDPDDVPALIEPIARGVADVVYGSRLVGGRPQRVHLFWHRVGNRALSLLTDVLFNTTLSDMESGYKAFRADVLASCRSARTASASSPRSPRASAAASCASTSCRCPTTGAATPRARRSPGATA